VLVSAGSLRAMLDARHRLAEQRQVSAAERASRELLEERARIARELHDVVAHHMSVIAIQAEAAPYRVADPPAELARSFQAIRASAVAALTELRRVLGLLRAGADEPDGAGPQPTLAGLDDLVANGRGAGLAVRTTVSGPPRGLPPGLELSAYRIVQEALSNAMRHAPGAEVRIDIRYRPESLTVDVANGPPRAPAAADPTGRVGHGLLGMRERAAMLGGAFTAGPRPDGGFGVTATLPCPPDADSP